LLVSNGAQAHTTDTSSGTAVELRRAEIPTSNLQASNFPTLAQHWLKNFTGQIKVQLAFTRTPKAHARQCVSVGEIGTF
jgi:hypothetical protein